MASADDTTPWDLLHDGRLVAIEADRVTIAVPHLGREFVLRLQGLERVAWLPYSDRWDEAETTLDDLRALVQPYWQRWREHWRE